MNTIIRRRTRIVALLVAFGAACGEGTTTPPSLERIVVAPISARVLEPGDSVRFGAFGVFSDGSRLPVVASWSTSAPDVADVDSGGWAIARSTGATVIEAAFGSERGSASFVVHSDTVAPSLEGVFAARTRVSVGAGPVVVPVTARFRDDGSGVRSVIGLFDGPLGVGITGLITFSSDSVETTADGDVSVHFGALGIPGLIGVGTWTLSALRADDVIGNSRRWGAEELARLGMTVEIVATTGDGG